MRHRLVNKNENAVNKSMFCVTGTVTVENEGLGGVTVKLSGTGESEWLTDGNGQYAFTGLRAGNYTIEISGFDDEDVSFGSSSSAATVAVGESKVVSFEGTYLRTSGILGQVTADNQPQEAVTVSLQGRGENRSMTTNSAGQYSFDGLRSGDYAIGISGYNTDEVSFDVTSQTVTVAYGETATLPFEGTLLRTAGIMGTVTVEGVGPIEDVTVTIQGNGETKSMPTNSDGMYSFNRLHAGDYSVTISGFDDDEYGFDVTTATVTVALQDTETVEFDGIMLRTAGISGEVTVGDDDTPLSGVTVTVSGGPRDEDHSATTHSDGTYLVENLHAGDYSVVISGYDTREYGFDPTTETVSVGLRETLEVAFQGTLLRTAGVSGRVSVNGMGIPGVTVTLTGEEDRDPENTNADGQFGFSGLAAGDYTLTISEYDAVEYAFEPTREFALELDGAEIMNFTGRALRTATVMGYVTVGDAPLPGIDVTLIMVVGTSGEIVGAMPTGETGGYTFGPLLAGAYQVNIGEYDDEYDFAAGDMQGTAVMTDSTATVNFAATIIRTASVSGRVTIAGDPMKDVTVTLTGDHAPDDNSRMTGDYGMYEFDDLRKGDYTLTISGYDAVDYHFEPTRESFALELGGSEIKNFTGKALRTATVMGYVTVEDAPLPGIGVTLIKVVSATSGEIVGAMATGADGGYAFGPLLAGAYQVRIGEYDDEYDFEAGDMQVTAVMTDSTATVNFAATIIRTAMVSGMVTIDGDPMKDVTVTIDGDHAPASPDNSMMTGDDGEYSFGELRKGAYTVTMTNPDDNAYSFPTVATPVNLGVGQAQPGISFAGTRLRRASISGQVHAEGDPVANVTVMLSGDADGEDMTDANGEYNFPGLAIGSYTVTISGWPEAAYIFDAPAMDAEIENNDDFLIVDFEGEHTKTARIGGMMFLDEVTRDLMHGAGEPALDLTDVLPEGMPGLPLTLLGPELTSVPTTIFANADGTYEFPGLQAGTYVINIDVDQVINAETRATVEDLLAHLGYEYTGRRLMQVDVDAGEEDLDNNLPFMITRQTINVGAVMGTPDMATTTMVDGVKLTLYPTYADADNGTNPLGSKTTADGVAAFDFLREDDDGPGGNGNDHLVFAKVTSTGHADLEFTDNRHIEIQYAATDRVSNALAAARLVNVQVNFQWWVKSNADAKGGNEFLEGWVAANGMATGADGKATYSERLTVEDAIAGESYTVMLNTTATQPDMGEKWVQSDAKEHTHDPLLLPDAERLNDLGAIYVTWTTQRLVLGVYRETDDVEGYTGYRSGLPRGDHRPKADVGKDMTVDLMVRDDDGRLETLKYDHDFDDETDMIKATGNFRAGGMKVFTKLPANKEITVSFSDKLGANRVLVSDDKDVETFGEDLDLGTTVGAFGEMSGAGPEVRLCSASSDSSDEWCATYGYQWTTGMVTGSVGNESGHAVMVEPTTGHGATGASAGTSSVDSIDGGRGNYTISGLQDGEYTATAVSGSNDYSIVVTAASPLDRNVVVYHDEYADETDEDEADSDWVGTRGSDEANWNTTRQRLKIMGYVANDRSLDDIIRGDEALAGVTLQLMTGVQRSGAGGYYGGTVVKTAETDAGGFYSFDELEEDTYQVRALSTSDYYAIKHAYQNRDYSGPVPAAVYPPLPTEGEFTAPWWRMGNLTMGGGDVEISNSAGTVSATLRNFALVSRQGVVTGRVNNSSGSSGGIDVRIVLCFNVAAADNCGGRGEFVVETGTNGTYEATGVLEAYYDIDIEDAFSYPCLDGGGEPNDDAVDSNGACSEELRTLVFTDTEGSQAVGTAKTLHVYDGRASDDDELGTVSVLGRSNEAGAGYDTATAWSAGWTRSDTDGTSPNTTSVGTTNWEAETVRFYFGSLNASIPLGGSVTIESEEADCSGYTCDLADNGTGADPDAGMPMDNTITVTTIAANGYNDHVYSTVVTREGPVGNGLAAEDIDRVDGSGQGAGTGGTTLATAYTLTTGSTATTVSVVISLAILGDAAGDNAFCAQSVTVSPYNGDALTADADNDDDVCPNTRYRLNGSATGVLYEVKVESQDGIPETYYLRVDTGTGT